MRRSCVRACAPEAPSVTPSARSVATREKRVRRFIGDPGQSNIGARVHVLEPCQPGFAAAPRLPLVSQPSRSAPAMPLEHGAQPVLHDDPALLMEAWDDLVDRSGDGPFCRPEWVCAWTEAFAPGELRVLALHRGDELAGVLPLLVRGRRAASPANSHTPSFDLVAADDEAARALAEEALRRFGRLELSYLPREGRGWPALGAAVRAARRPAVAWAPVRSPYVALEGDFESYCGALSRNFRKELRRNERRLGEQGELEIAFEAGDANLDEGLALEGSGWKQDTAILADPRSERLYRRVCAWAAERGTLRLCFVRVAGRAVAFDLCLVEDGAMYALKGGFDTGFRKYGPGMLLTWRSVEYAYASGLETYELLGADDDYKRRWTDRTRERLRLQVFSRSPRGLAGWSAYAWARPAARRARRLEPAPRVELPAA